MLPLASAAIVAAMVWWLVGTLGLGYASAGSLLALLLLPVCVMISRGSPQPVVLGIALFILAAARHWENIVRLTQE